MRNTYELGMGIDTYGVSECDPRKTAIACTFHCSDKK